MVMVREIRKILFLMLALSVFCVPVVHAAGIGTVDTRILLILHPDMVNFDYSSGRFFRDQDPNKSIESVYADLQKASEETEKANAEIDKKIRELSERRFKLSQDLLREEQFFAPGDLKQLQKEKADFETVLKELERTKPSSTVEADLQDARKEDIKKRISDLENALSNSANFEKREPEIKKLKEQMAQIDVELVKFSDEKRKNEEEAVKIVYLTTPETEERLSSVKSEVKKIISEVSEEEKITLVIDNTFAARTPPIIARNTMVPISDGAPDLMSASLFHSFSSYETDKLLEDSLPMPEGVSAADHLLIGRTAGLQNNLRQYLEFKSYLPEKAADLSHGSIFLNGGKDLTVLCASKIFAKYNVPDLLKQSYIHLLEEYMKPVK